MTREEVIEKVKNYENYPNGLSKECRDYILKALEQEPILDRIRVEIDSLEWWCNGEDYFVNRKAVDCILDKYKAESEE